MNLTAKYAPKYLRELRGQGAAVKRLQAFCAKPESCAFLFSGETGVGKTTAALIIARNIGCNVDACELGGFHQVASGEQSADNVRDVLRRLWYTPFYSTNGWKVLVVNECDQMHAQAQVIWLDALENLPPHTIIIFTTNAAGKLAPRFRDRCETINFASAWDDVRDEARKFAMEVWKAETGRTDPPDVPGCIIDGQFSFRRMLQKLTTLCCADAPCEASLF